MIGEPTGSAGEIVMASPLLETKLHVPRRRPGSIARPRLTERLSHGSGPALTLLSAPPGFGKTTLLTEWLAAAPTDGRSVAWLSLDQRDNDPVLFWTYVVTALDSAARGVGAGALVLLRSPQPSMDAVLATLLNDVRGVPDDVVLVLDDYHVIEARGVHEGMAFLLEHLPPQLRVVIASRADPPLPLARMRARGELVEVRAADLRMTAEEAAAYFNDAMGLTLTAGEIAALEGRTEGWIAALQLAALSLHGRNDAAAFIAGFTGDDRYIVDYLVEEVLQRQPEHVRTFLLRTSVLSRLNGSLCDAVTGQDGGRAMLEALDRANLFLVPLDDQRRWYRYHHLFGDVLHARVLDEQPGRLPELHRRASDWFEQNGERSEAIDHALAAGDVERAADLVELAVPAMAQRRQEATLRRWLEALPEEVFRARPVLSIGYVGMRMLGGEVEGVERRLRDAERWLDATTDVRGQREGPSAQMIVVDQAGYRGLSSRIAVYRAGQALIHGDVAGTMTHARRALELVGEDDHLMRASAAGLLGLAYWTTGDLEAGHRWYAECTAGLYRAGHLSDTFGCAIALADIRLVQGRLGEAMRTYEQALQRGPGHGGSALRGTADMYVGMSQLHRERDDLAAATQDLLRSQELGEHAGLPQNPYRWRVAMARIREAEGDLGAALDLIEEAERLYTGDFFPDVRPVPAVRARLWLGQGAWGRALGWARERDLSVEDDLSYLREFEHITLVRALLARYAAEPAELSIDDVSRLVERLLHAAEEGHRWGSVIEILVLQARAHQLRGDLSAARAALQRAVTLAEPEGYVRIFADEGPPMAALLRAVAKQGTAPGYVRRLLAALNGTTSSPLADQGVIEPLSERELEVLRLLGTDLDGPAIARELVVSLNTVRTHTTHIYTKLGVNNRRAAVRRAGELGLLSRSHRQPRRAVVPDR
jgi:LuxR family maltose regulon positive regulatory protein